MRLAVLSDIHGNLGAFEAVLADIAAQDVDDIISLGDNVGYGPDPGPVLRLLRQRGIDSVLGNHEAAIADRRRRRRFNSQSREALDLTEAWLDADGRACIASMPPVLLRHGCRFVHGMPPDSPFTYLFEFMGRRLPKVFTLFAEALCFVGHTHDLEVLRCDETGAVASVLLPQASPDVAGQMPRGASSGASSGALHGTTLETSPGAQSEALTLSTASPRVTVQTLVLDAGARHLVNVGSVGQPRDGDPRAKYVVWDDTARTLTVRRVAYDVAAAVHRFAEAGVAQRYIDRLG
ncbi:metallophosphoesterase family protein [Nitratidesulfovibrio vulgaris]|uniref:metallophosphoesterase family protein n=1 Tax=Nitratidesulfovibrio vulgaris TaxID=881 RepID=UPI0013DF4EC5|nr:metallophosphoesterase family protein [Nitratidesulfovibrio vulgaris]WCB47180.1 metallophosphoesterase family protein [Nitratidesulfovibrio vulgaris]